MTIEHLVSLANENLIDHTCFDIADSSTKKQVDQKLEYALLLYKTTLPLIKQHIIY